MMQMKCPEAEAGELSCTESSCNLRLHATKDGMNKERVAFEFGCVTRYMFGQTFKMPRRRDIDHSDASGSDSISRNDISFVVGPGYRRLPTATDSDQ